MVAAWLIGGSSRWFIGCCVLGAVSIGAVSIGAVSMAGGTQSWARRSSQRSSSSPRSKTPAVPDGGRASTRQTRRCGLGNAAPPVRSPTSRHRARRSCHEWASTAHTVAPTAPDEVAGPSAPTRGFDTRFAEGVAANTQIAAASDADVLVVTADHDLLFPRSLVVHQRPPGLGDAGQ